MVLVRLFTVCDTGFHRNHSDCDLYVLSGSAQKVYDHFTGKGINDKEEKYYRAERAVLLFCIPTNLEADHEYAAK